MWYTRSVKEENLTSKEEKYARFRAAGKSKTESALAAYGMIDRSNAGKYGSRVEKRPKVQNLIAKSRVELRERMNILGLTPEFIANDLHAILHMAPENKMRWEIHLSALKEAAKLQDLYPKDTKEMNARLTFAKNLFSFESRPDQGTDPGNSGGPEV